MVNIMVDYSQSLEDFKKTLQKLLDMILKYLPSKTALDYKEQIANLKDKNTDLELEISNLVMKTVGNDFEEKAKQVAAKFSETVDRISNGDKDYTDLMEYCDTDRMLKDAEEILKDKLKEDPSQTKTLAQFLREEKPGREFDENDKKAICNELVARGYTQMIDYFDSKSYLDACFSGKIDLGVDINGSIEEGIFVSPDNDRTLVLNLDKAIQQGKEYIAGAIRTDIDGFHQAYDDSKLVVEDALQRIYIDRNIQVENAVISEDNFFMYGDVVYSGLANGVVEFSYDKETHEIQVDFSSLDVEPDETTKEALYTKCYDVIDEYQAQQEYDAAMRQAEREQQEEELEEDDPYGERSLF